jgi:hypothetical protein
LDNAAVRAGDKCILPGSERRRLILRIDTEDRIIKILGILDEGEPESPWS